MRANDHCNMRTRRLVVRPTLLFFFLLLFIRANYFNIISLSANQSNQPTNQPHPLRPFFGCLIFCLVDVVCVGYEWLRSYSCVFFAKLFSSFDL